MIWHDGQHLTISLASCDLGNAWDAFFFTREPQHTPRSIPQTSPNPPKWKEFLHKLLVGGFGVCLRGLLEKSLDFFISKDSITMISWYLDVWRLRDEVSLITGILVEGVSTHGWPRYPVTRYYGTLEGVTPWKFNIAPEKWWLEDYFPIGKVTFQGTC